MAKKRSGKRRATSRRNPSRRRKGHARRRRNPSGGFGDSAMKLAGGAVVALVAGAAGLVAMSKIQPGQPISTYGVPAAGFLLGAALYKKYPTLGAGIALGSVASPFAIPLASKVLPSLTSTTTTPAASTTAAATTAGIARARMMGMGAVHMGGLGAVHMGAFPYRYAT